MYTSAWSNTRSRVLRESAAGGDADADAGDNKGSSGSSDTTATATTLTTDAIVRECVRLGYYRNPICNDILYLHHKSYTHIDADAFAPYTNVKVLWLEGNALSSLACGDAYVRVRPPAQDNPFAHVSDNEDDDSDSDEKQQERPQQTHNTHVDPHASLPSCTHDTNNNNKEGSTACGTTRRRAALPEASTVPRAQRDVFSSLYGTLRQLYLHNNVLRRMPDMRRFARLDAVNLSYNFIGRVEACCTRWLTSMQREEAERTRAAAAAAVCDGDKAKSAHEADTALVVHASKSAGDDDDGGDGGGGTGDEAVAQWRQRCVQLYSSWPTHCRASDNNNTTTTTAADAAADAADDAARQTRVPRCVCASLHTLNLAHNQLRTFDDVLCLLSYPSLSVLDLSNNDLRDGEAVLCVLERLPRLRSLKLSGNPLVRTLPRYRKTVVARCQALTYLDDRPVFAEERRLTRAWADGGDVAEAAERRRIAAEKAQAEQRRLDEFRALLAGHAPVKDENNDTTTRTTTTTRRNEHTPHRRNASEDDDSVTSSSSSSDEDEDGDAEAEHDNTTQQQQSTVNSADKTKDTHDECDAMTDVYIPGSSS